MVIIDVLDKISINNINITTFRVSRHSDIPEVISKMNIIGVMFLECPEDAKTKYKHSLLPGYIHMKDIKNLKDKLKTYHQQCFETISNGNIDDFLVLGFGVNYGNEGLKLNSSTFNVKLNNRLDKSNDREAIEFFTPILQTVMRKFKGEFNVGFTLNVAHIPLKIYNMYTEIYPNKHLSYELKKIPFCKEKEFEKWCREYYTSLYNTIEDFNSWFKKRNCSIEMDDNDFFTKFKIVS